MSRERVIPVRIERGPSPAVSVQQTVIPAPAPTATVPVPAPAPPLAAPQPRQPSPAAVGESPTAPSVRHTPPPARPLVTSEASAEPPTFSRPPLAASTSFNAQIGDKVVGMLDEIERRVENLRETASLMEQEKESLVEILNNVQLNKDLLQISQGEKEDIEVTTNRLLTRCRTVAVSVSTVRNKEQEKALENVNTQMDELIGKMKEDVEASKEACEKFLNACNPEQPDGPIDQRFQSMVIECTADDQKKIRKRLEHLLQAIHRTDKTIAQAN